MTTDQKIDFVIPWVDGSDPAWLAERSRYDQKALAQGIDDARFRDWGTLRYVLRSIEQYADWVHNVYLITYGHLPSWLDTSHPKLKVIRHEDYIPSQYLPTFSSHVIELNMHRIPGLSEQFVYFNDDMLFDNPVQPEDFFVDGKPCGSGVLHIHCVTKQNMIYTICNNNTELINEHFRLKETLKVWSHWYNLKYGLKNLLETIVLTPCPRFPGIQNTHLPNPYLKSTFEEVWAKEPEILDETSRHKFREKTDVNQWLMLNWQLASNRFHPVASRNRGVLIDFEKDGEIDEVLDRCQKALDNPHYKMICINDGDTVGDYEMLKEKVTEMLEKKFPHPSRYEKTPV